MSRATGTPDPRTAFRALTATFLRRFFDNEITGGTQDLRTSFFWLIGFMAGPLTLIPGGLMVTYHLIAARFGPEGLRVLSRPHKMFVIVLGMTAAGLLVAVVWNSLMLERRDGLILGALPIRGRVVVLAKLAALATYIFGLSSAIHAVSSLIFGLILSERAPSLLFMLMSPIAHFTAAVTSCAFVFLVVTSAQGVALAVAGPGGFRRVSPILHIGLVATLVISVTKIPAILSGVARFSQLSHAQPLEPWLMLAPPVWFLGLYEWMLGDAGPVYTTLAGRAAAALGVTMALTLSSYAVIYRRVMVRAVEVPEGAGGGWRLSVLLEWITRSLSTVPARRASAQFLFTSLGRVERLRFVIAVMLGLVAAWIVPALLFLVGNSAGSPSPQTMFKLSYATLVLVLLGLRIAISMPADLRASWIVPMTDTPGRLLRSGLWRALFVLSVVPVTLSFAALHASLWGVRVSLLHAGVMAAVGCLLVEIALWHFDDLPCRRPWRPEHANLRVWWPAYLAGFLIVTGTIPRLEQTAGGSLGGHLAMAAACVLVAVIVRIAHRRPYPPPDTEIELFVEPPHVLKLE